VVKDVEQGKGFGKMPQVEKANLTFDDEPGSKNVLGEQGKTQE